MTDPRARLLLLFAVGAFAVVLDRPASLAVLAAASAAPLFFVRSATAWRGHAAVAIAAVIWSTVLSQGLFYSDHPRTPILVVGPVVLVREGVVHGLVQSLRLVATTSAGLALALSTPPDRLVAGMTALKVPWPVAFLAVTALRMVPLVTREMVIVRGARARRGGATRRRSPRAWLREELAGIRPVAARALRRAHTLAEALDARGYDPDRPPRARPALHLGWMEAAVVAGVYAALAALVAIEALYLAYLGEVLYLPALRPLYGWARIWL